MLWTVALQTVPAGDSALLIAATPVMTALLAMAVGADTPNSVKVVGALTSFLGVGLVIAAGEGLVLGASLIGDGLDVARGRVLGDLHGVRGRHPATALSARHIDLGAGRRDVCMAPVGIAQLATDRPVRRRATACCSRSSMRASSRQGRPMWSSSRA